jgi:alpha-beta hydrolase superfamily lysophospholipase
MGRGRTVAIRIAAALAAASALAAAAFLVWALTPAGPSPVARVAMRLDALVTVTEAADGIEFAPATTEPTAALVFYPGGRIDARSYAPFAREVASHGYLVVVTRMTLNLAVFSPDRAGDALAAHPGIAVWAVGGHSLGGAMAARYAAGHPDRIGGLLLLASYPPASTDLSRVRIACASVFGTRDAGARRMREAVPMLPRGTVVVAVPGGNHAQFGSYGPQPGDASATVPAAVQRAAAVKATVQMLRRAQTRGRAK